MIRFILFIQFRFNNKITKNDTVIIWSTQPTPSLIFKKKHSNCAQEYQKRRRKCLTLQRNPFTWTAASTVSTDEKQTKYLSNKKIDYANKQLIKSQLCFWFLICVVIYWICFSTTPITYKYYYAALSVSWNYKFIRCIEKIPSPSLEKQQQHKWTFTLSSQSRAEHFTCHCFVVSFSLHRCPT